MFFLRFFIVLTILISFIPHIKATELTDLGKGISKMPRGVLGIITSYILEDEKTSDKDILTFICCLSKIKQLNSHSTTFTAQKLPISPKALSMRFFNTMTGWIDLNGGDKCDLSNVEVARYLNTLFNLIEENPKSEELKYCALSYEIDIRDVIQKTSSLLTHHICNLFLIGHDILSDHKICDKKEWEMVHVQKEQVVPLFYLYFLTKQKNQPPRNKEYFFEYFLRKKEYEAAAEILDDNHKNGIAKFVRHYTDTKQYEKALLMGKKLLLFEDGIINYGIDIARLYARIGKFGDAAEVCAQVIKAQKNRFESHRLPPATHYCMAFYLIRDNRPKECFPYLKKFMKLSRYLTLAHPQINFPLRISFIKGVETAIENNQIVFDSIEEKNKFLQDFSEIQSKFVIKEDEY